MIKQQNAASIYQLGANEFTEELNKAGYQNVFDITSESFLDFSQHNPTIPSPSAREIYHLAEERVENLKMLCLAWQLHNDPVVRNIPKLSSSTGLEEMKSVLSRSLGEGSNFGDLFPERSPDGYAEATSIQSLFSPGRYLTVLYKIARQLHSTSSDLHIDKRRPDLKSLILSTDNMNREVSSLDILLDVLTSSSSQTIESLKDTYHPMTLPYDDNLTQISAVAKVKSTDLISIWKNLLDTEGNIFLQNSNGVFGISKMGPSDSTVEKASVEPVLLAGEEFYMRANNTLIYFANNIVSGAYKSVFLTIGPQQALSVEARFQIVYYSSGGNRGKYYLRVADGVTFGQNILTNHYLTSDNGQNTNTSGPYCMMANRNNNTTPLPIHLPIEIEMVTNKTIRIFVPNYGYFGPGVTLGSNWQNPLALDLDLNDALTFTMSSDAAGQNPILVSEVFPSVADTTPLPPTRETLSLTPNSFRLLVNPTPTLEDISNHFNVSGGSTASMASALNVVDDFCLKTGLSFNQVLMLTAQKDYLTKGSEYQSRFIKFGTTTNASVSEYGAVFLTGTETTPLWMSQYNSSGTVTQTPVLNFTAGNVVGFASRAERLVRLSHSTGLSFEQLDWLIVNASRGMIKHGGEIILDGPVLTAIAEFIRLNQRYAITSDVFTAFIGNMNTYALESQHSFYRTVFRMADDSTVMPLGTTLRFQISSQGLYESVCCGAMGVTADEFYRIGQYCFGNNVQQITANETNTAQLYRMGTIPKMLGLSFTEAELLWKTMDGGNDSLLRIIGQEPSALQVLDVIRRTEVILEWMDSHNLDVVALQAMVTHTYSSTATPELYNFLKKVYESTSGVSVASRIVDPYVTEKLNRALAAGFNLKVNIMTQVISWMEKSITGFTLQEFWNKILIYFSESHENELVALEQMTQLVQWCQQMSQYVMIVQWCGLSEQDLALLGEHPEHLLDGQRLVPKSSLYLLLMLSRLKEWQQRVLVSSDEAMRYFAQANLENITSNTAIELLAHIHGWNETYTASMNYYLWGVDSYPKSFEQIFKLESWVGLGNQLNIDSRTLGELVSMSGDNEDAESSQLISSVSQSLMAAAQA